MLKTSLKIGLQCLLIFGFVLNIYGQDVVIEEVRPEIEAIAERMAEGEMFTGRSIGYSAVTSPQWIAFKELKEVALEEELILLTDHKSPAVRCYAFQVLVDKQSENTFEILKKHLKERASVETMHGCIVMREMVGDVL
ncbi:MAG: hypothetical protein AB8B69_22050, partial [Chitinophagales bacterium]